MQEPNFLVEAPDGKLYGYTRPDLLKIDLAGNRDHPPTRIFRLDRSSMSIAYEPVDMSELMPPADGAVTQAHEIEGRRELLLLRAGEHEPEEAHA